MSFDQIVIEFASPAICGIKPSSLFSVKDEVYHHEKARIQKWNSEFNDDGLSFISVKRNMKSVLLLVCNRNLVRSVLSCRNCERYLASKNYPVTKGIDCVFSELLSRLENQPQFPHEIGLFLGYPLEDVRNFEKNEKSEFFTDIWKVYDNPEETKKRIALYRSCTSRCRSLLDDGASVSFIAKKFRKEQKYYQTGVS